MGQSISATVAGLFSACQTIYASSVDSLGAPVLVTYGPPSTYQPEQIVAVGMDIRQPVTRPTLGTTRSREKEAEIDVVISVYVAGGDEVQQTASESCSALSELLESRFRTSPNETLGGACREAWVSNVAGPKPSVALDPMSGGPTGRVAESVVTVTARIRQ